MVGLGNRMRRGVNKSKNYEGPRIRMLAKKAHSAVIQNQSFKKYGGGSQGSLV